MNASFRAITTSVVSPLVSVIYAQVVQEDRMSAASTDIANLLRDRHDIQFQADDDFTVINQQDLLSIFGQITGVLTIFLGAIAGISLLVGGIGIMNIMLVSVTERTREIGLRKAVGAKRRDILNQFLIESVIMSVIGGLLGIGLGALGAALVSKLASGLGGNSDTAVHRPRNRVLCCGRPVLRHLSGNSCGALESYRSLEIRITTNRR